MRAAGADVDDPAADDTSSTGAGPEPFAVLFVREDAPAEVVTAAYRALAKMHHPDAGGDAAKFRAVRTAYDAILRHQR